MLTAIIVITSISQILLSLFVLSRAHNNLSNRLFFLIGITTLGWALADYISYLLLSSPNVVYIARLVLFFVVLQTACFYLFARTFPRSTWEHSKKWLAIYVVVAISVALLTFSSLVFKSVTTNNTSTITNVGPGIIAFILFIIFSVVTGFASLGYRAKNSYGSQKRQLEILIFASTLPWILVPITNFGITQLTGTTVFTKYAPIYTLVFVAIIAYAIIAQKLFDIRAAVARSVAYVLIIITMTGLYGLLLFGVVNVIFKGPDSELTRQILSIALLTPLALAFQKTKLFFDRFTNDIFYRDAYEPQELFDQLNKVLVATIDTDELMLKSISVLEASIKSEFVLIGLKDKENGQRIFGSRKARFDQKTIDKVRELTPHFHHKVIVADYIENERYMSLKEIMSANQVAVIVRLTQDVRKSEEGLGYIVLGARKSGNPYTQQDIRVLDTVANELIIAIQNALHFEEIQNFNKTLQTKVDEATRKLRSSNARLRELDESKDDFISMASHQLRTPLTSVKGYLSMVLEGDAGKLTATQTQMLKQSFMSAQRTVYIISDLLNVSRLKTGKFIIDTAPTDLSKVVQEEVDQLKETALSRHVDLLYDKPDNFPELMLDETKTRQVIMNFIDNAIYYTPANGNIKVRLIDGPTTIELRVEDDGIGVPKAEQHHLFTKFYRARNAQRARPDGTGLGLFMAKKVVMSQGGAIIFESKEGVGSTFGFIFSKSELKVVPAPPPPSKPRAKAKVIAK